MNDLQILEWYVTAGVDEVIGNEPVNKLDVVQQQPAPQKQEQKVSAPVIQPIIKKINVQTVDLANQATTLAELQQIIANFNTPLKKTALNMVFADGNPQSDLMIVGEAPGEEEDKQGLPFVGKSGQLLDLILKSIGHDRTNTYITNVVNFRPPNNRTPSPDEMALFLPFLQKHIEFIHPKVILCLGKCAFEALTNSPEGIIQGRGKWRTFKDIPLMPSFHPSYLLRQPLQKSVVWHDFLAVQQKLEQI